MDYRIDYDYFNDNGNERERNIHVEHRRRLLYQVDIRILLRDAADPFAISTTEFQRLYRIPQHMVLELVRDIAAYVREGTGERSAPVEIKVLCALAFYASGSYQRIVGRMSDINISQSCVSNFIGEITDALNHAEVLTRYIRFPLTRGEREHIIERNSRLGLPRVLGFIDGTLVKIVPPSLDDHREAYYCRKGYTALNVQIVCDADLYILDVNSRYPGSCNDPFIYRYSAIREEMMTAYRASRCWLLGDSAYPHEPWLHTPLPHAEPHTPEYMYTRLHCHCRNAVERCIGVLKARWRCLLHDRTLHYKPEKAGKIVNACALLHNFCLLRNLPDPRQRCGHDDSVNNGNMNNNDDHDDEEVDLPLRELANQERRFLIEHAQRMQR